MLNRRMPSYKTKKLSTKNNGQQAQDSVFFFKLVLYLILGTLWVKVYHGQTQAFPIPVGLIIGLILTTHEHFQMDRKIEYAVLLVSMLVGLFAPFGLYISY